MSEAWRKLIETDDRALADCLSLARVSISKKTGNMKVRLNSTRLLTKSEYALIENRFAGAFPAVRVETAVSYPDLHDRVQDDITVALGLFREILKRESPGATVISS